MTKICSVMKLGMIMVTGVLGVLASACASGPFALEVRHAGKLDPEKDEKVAEKAQDLPWDGEYSDIVVTNEVPAGLAFEKNTLTSSSAEQYVVLGSVRSFMDDTRQVAFAKSMFWFESMHPSHSSTRDMFCKVQFPLRTLTLGIWGLLSPTSWPCYVLYSKKLSVNSAIHRGELQRAARAMGGNLVVLAGIDAEVQSYTTGYGWNAGTGHESVPGATATGWIVIDKSKTPGGAPRQPAPPPAPAAPAPAPSNGTSL